MRYIFTKNQLFYTTLSILTLFFSVSSFTNIKTGSDLDSKLTLKTKSIKTNEFRAIEVDGNIKKGGIYWNYNETNNTNTIFNNQGNIIEEIIYKKDGKELKSTFTFIYDKKNNIVKESKFKSDGSIHHKNFMLTYDKKGNLIKNQQVREDGKLGGSTIYNYDKKGNLIEKKIFSTSEYLFSQFNFEYNSKGDVIYEKVSTPDKKNRKLLNIQIEKNIKYDKKGNSTEVKKFKRGYKLFYTITGKDHNGKKLETTTWRYYESGEKDKEEYTKYDDKGNEIEYIRFYEDGSIHTQNTTRYEFDDNDNWVKKIEFKNDEPLFIVEREIKYFN